MIWLVVVGSSYRPICQAEGLRLTDELNPISHRRNPSCALQFCRISSCSISWRTAVNTISVSIILQCVSAASHHQLTPADLVTDQCLRYKSLKTIFYCCRYNIFFVHKFAPEYWINYSIVYNCWAKKKLQLCHFTNSIWRHKAIRTELQAAASTNDVCHAI